MHRNRREAKGVPRQKIVVDILDPVSGVENEEDRFTTLGTRKRRANCVDVATAQKVDVELAIWCGVVNRNRTDLEYQRVMIMML